MFEKHKTWKNNTKIIADKSKLILKYLIQKKKEIK